MPSDDVIHRPVYGIDESMLYDDGLSAPADGSERRLAFPEAARRHRPGWRAHFAGEHTSSRKGSMEGALDRAEHVSAELLRVRAERASV